MQLKTSKAVFVVFVGLLLSCSAMAQSGVTTQTGMLPDGATYIIEVPSNWNGILFLYSHGFVVPGAPNPALDYPTKSDPLTHGFMLSSGFALAGSSYATTGWAIEQALPDQISVLDIFNKMVGTPRKTIAWGHSLGGMVTAGLIQRYPDRFDAALPMCGVLSGGVATWNTALDSAFAFKTLLGGSGLQLVNIKDPTGNLILAEAILVEAEKTPQGRARLALSSALADTPGWFVPLSSEPAASDFAGRQANQFLWAQMVDFPFAFALRAELEFRAQGNVSWNTGVDYRRQLERSASRNEVVALYEQAGLSLDSDLDALENASRISPDHHAIEYLEKNIVYNGDIHIPVLTMHTTGDGLVVVENESAYSQVVREDGNGQFLRRTFVSRAGHCSFTPAETIAAVQTLLTRLQTGAWPDVAASNMNAAAESLGPGFNIFAAPQGGIVPVPPGFVDFKPAPYLRPFAGESEECEFGTQCGDDH